MNTQVTWYMRGLGDLTCAEYFLPQSIITRQIATRSSSLGSRGQSLPNCLRSHNAPDT